MKYWKYYLFSEYIYILLQIIIVDSFNTDHNGISSDSHNPQLVDPDSLYYKPHLHNAHAPSKKYNIGAIGHFPQEEENQIALRDDKKSYQKYLEFPKDSSYEVFSRRLINILIKKANFKVTEDKNIGHLFIEVTNEELELLQDFGKGTVSFRQLDSIIGEVVQSIPVDFTEEVLSFIDQWSIYIYQHRVIFGTTLLTIFVTIFGLKIKWTQWKIILLIFYIIIAISFFLTWWELLQESEIKLMASQAMFNKIPKECKKSELGVFDSIMLFFGYGEGDCVKYYEAIMLDPVLKVTPLHAFCTMCSKTIFLPISEFGRIVTEFINTTTDSLPYVVQIIVKPILICSIPMLLIGFFFIFFGGAFGLRIGPVFHFYLHGRQANVPENSIASDERRTIQVIRSEIRETLLATKSELKIKNTTNSKHTQTDIQDINTPISQKLKLTKKPGTNVDSEEFSETDEEYEKISKHKIDTAIKETEDSKLGLKKTEREGSPYGKSKNNPILKFEKCVETVKKKD